MNKTKLRGIDYVLVEDEGCRTCAAGDNMLLCRELPDCNQFSSLSWKRLEVPPVEDRIKALEDRIKALEDMTFNFRGVY